MQSAGEQELKTFIIEETITRIYNRINHLHDIEQVINDTLGDIGKVSGASRVYLFFFKNPFGKAQDAHVWYAPGVPAEVVDLQDLLDNIYPEWTKTLAAGSVVDIADVEQLPPTKTRARELLRQHYIKALLLVPWQVKGVLAGCIGLDRTDVPAVWNRDVLWLLRVSAMIIGSALERHAMQRELMVTQSRYRTIFENTGTATVIINEDLTINMVNAGFERLTGYTKKETEGKMNWLKLFPHHWQDIIKSCHTSPRSNPNTKPQSHEMQILDCKGNLKDVIISLSPLPGTGQSVASLLDITRNKRVERQLHYLSFHDPLTGLYNRTYFEQIMQGFVHIDPRDVYALVVCDVDGLKLLNETMGYDKGDALLMVAAVILKEAFGPQSIVARIDGSKFGIIVPGGEKYAVYRACAAVKRAITRHNASNPKLNFNISIGFAFNDKTNRTMPEVFNEATNIMNREKLLYMQSNRGTLVRALNNALRTKQLLPEQRAQRLEHLVLDFCTAKSIPVRSLADLRLLVHFHDLGKLGIAEDILFKPGPLTGPEVLEMQRHCEIGYRIAMCSPDLVPIADWILKHHEWWNGGGYPLGIKEEQIPLECRILAIADAYESMTCSRAYGQKKTPTEALGEILYSAGIQFDPLLARQFISFLSAN